MPNTMNVWIKKAFAKLVQDSGGSCQNCGSKEDLEFAHIKPTTLTGRGRGRKERYYDIKNNMDSYMLLCKTCHKELDENV